MSEVSEEDRLLIALASFALDVETLLGEEVDNGDDAEVKDPPPASIETGMARTAVSKV